MEKKTLLFVFASLFLASVPQSDAQQANKFYRMGYLSSVDAARESARSDAIRRALRELGYLEGQNITFDYRYGEGKIDRAPDFLAELVRLKVDIIVVAGADRWVRAAKNATRTIPIVMMGGGSDPVKASLIESLARPGGNVTGMTSLGGDVLGKRLELLREIIPKFNRAGFLWNPSSPIAADNFLPVYGQSDKIPKDRSDHGNLFGVNGTGPMVGLLVRLLMSNACLS